jgi:hypothetical protein
MVLIREIAALRCSVETSVKNDAYVIKKQPLAEDRFEGTSLGPTWDGSKWVFLKQRWHLLCLKGGWCNVNREVVFLTLLKM